MSLTTAEKTSVISKFKKHDKDTGSSEVQIALLTKRIEQLTEHFKKHVKDHASRRGLIMLVNQRRSLLAYLKSQDQVLYSKILKDLGIRG